MIPELKSFAIDTLSKIKTNNEVLNIKGDFSHERQKELSVIILKLIGFDFSYGRLDISEHPTTLANSLKIFVLLQLSIKMIF